MLSVNRYGFRGVPGSHKSIEYSCLAEKWRKFAVAARGAGDVQNDTMCRFLQMRAWNWRLLSGGLNRRGIDQQDRNVILDGIHAPALRAFQTGRVFPQGKRLLAGGTNENIEQVLRNHKPSF